MENKKYEQKSDVSLVKDGNNEPTDFGKVISASSRFRPSQLVVFDKPIIGKNGNKLISYQWAYEWAVMFNYEGEVVGKRISDWTQAQSSAETGRGIVHQFTVERNDGTIVTVSSETIPSLLGYVDAAQMKNLPSIVSSVKTLAKQRMQLAILEAKEKEYNELKNKYTKAKKPKIEALKMDKENAPSAWRRMVESGAISRTIFIMGDAMAYQDNPSTYNIETGKKNYTENNIPSNYTIEYLEYQWVSNRVKEDGGEYPQGIYELRRRIERQEKKVEQATGSKIKTIEQAVVSKPVEKLMKTDEKLNQTPKVTTEVKLKVDVAPKNKVIEKLSQAKIISQKRELTNAIKALEFLASIGDKQSMKELNKLKEQLKAIK